MPSPVACAAALAGCGQGKDAGKLAGDERTRLRNQALGWLKADLEAWRRLLAQLPPHLRPDEFSCTLTVLDLPEADAFSGGGGYVYLTASLLQRLTADMDPLYR